jgi:hypothetical protein
MKKSLSIVIAMAAFFGVAACSSQTPFLGKAYFGSYERTAFNHAARNGEVPTVVYGNPFAGDRAAFAQEVAARMKPPAHYGGPVAFTAVGSSRDHRLAMIFNPASGQSDIGLCRNQVSKTKGRVQEELRVLAAFCAGERVLSSVRGRVEAISSSADPRFQQLLDQVSLALFPIRNPDIDGEDRDFPPL